MIEMKEFKELADKMDWKKCADLITEEEVKENLKELKLQKFVLENSWALVGVVMPDSQLKELESVKNQICFFLRIKTVFDKKNKEK